jgi:hypothetical protein
MNCKKGTQRISHEWGLELWWQLYLYVTSGSGLRKKPAITLCAFECTTCYAGNQLCCHPCADDIFSGCPEFVYRVPKRLMSEADQSCPTSVEVKNAWSRTRTSLYVSATLCLMERIFTSYLISGYFKFFGFNLEVIVSLLTDIVLYRVELWH